MFSLSFPDLFSRLVAGDQDTFFRNHWRRRVLHQPNAIEVPAYTCEQFLEEYRLANRYKESLVVAIDDQGIRRMVRPTHDWIQKEFMAAGGSLVLQAIRLPRDWHDMPDVWRNFVRLHDQICNYVLPGLPPGQQPDGPIAAVDFFYTSGETSTGGHYDPGDVFYFVLDGMKEWTVEFEPDTDTVLKLYESPHEHFMSDHSPTKESTTLCVKPGDCLYVPPFTYHRVASHGPTLAVSLGLPTYTEATLLKTLLRQLERDGRHWNIWDPLPTYPERFSEEYLTASTESSARVTSLLSSLKKKANSIYKSHPITPSNIP